MVPEYPWYALVESEDLEQGDFIDEGEVIIPQYALFSPEVAIETNQPVFQVSARTEVYDLVIVSQSCDLENGKIENVLTCPRWSLQDYVELNSDFRKADKLEQIRQGKYHRYCMLNSCDLIDHPHEVQIIDLGTVFSIPYHTVKQLAILRGKRLRLLSPYKEKLAQAFAYYYMRVALPVDIPKFEKTKLLTQARIKLPD